MSKAKVATFVQDSREWVVEHPLRYYVHQFTGDNSKFASDISEFRQVGKWAVIDRKSDLCVTDLFLSKAAALRQFATIAGGFDE
jgi:hypothetical protein